MALAGLMKGKEAERQIASELNTAINGLIVNKGLRLPREPVVQRNQNQSAVGGKDLLIRGLPLAIEVKRQEALSVSTWWAQCVAQASRYNETPILIYRRNKERWRVVMNAYLWTGGSKYLLCPSTISWTDFMNWFRNYVETSIEQGWSPDE